MLSLIANGFVFFLLRGDGYLLLFQYSCTLLNLLGLQTIITLLFTHLPKPEYRIHFNYKISNQHPLPPHRDLDLAWITLINYSVLEILLDELVWQVEEYQEDMGPTTRLLLFSLGQVTLEQNRFKYFYCCRYNCS